MTNKKLAEYVARKSSAGAAEHEGTADCWHKWQTRDFLAAIASELIDLVCYSRKLLEHKPYTPVAFWCNFYATRMLFYIPEAIISEAVEIAERKVADAAATRCKETL